MPTEPTPEGAARPAFGDARSDADPEGDAVGSVGPSEGVDVDAHADARTGADAHTGAHADARADADASDRVLRNHRGEQLTFTRRPATPDDPLEVHALYIPGDGPPPRHSHPNQEVSFEVLEGALRVWIDDDEPFVAAPGHRFEIPAGTVYAVGPDGDEPCRFARRIEPALQSERLFRHLWRLNADRPARIGEIARVLLRHRREYRLERPPGWIQVPLFATLAAIDVVQGWLRRS